MSLFRPDVDRIDGYVPGEQPQDDGWIKLNTNENPYPPSPRVAAAVASACAGRLNIYPDPLASRFRKATANLFNVDPDWILPANGSDENLTILNRTFVDSGELVTYPYPSYILYETLADLQGAAHERLQLNADWSWDIDRVRPQIERSKLVLVPNPNSPSGNCWAHDSIAELVPPNGIFVLDEAYGDFRDEPHRGEILHTDVGRRIVITRTLSKSYSLAGIRFGFAIAHPDLISGMRKVKDSYNCNTLSLAAATAAIEDQDWMLESRRRIVATRARLTVALREIGFHVVDSQANFVWTTHPERSHQQIYEALKARKVLVRFMKFADVLDGSELTGLRITVGTDDEIDGFLQILREILQ
ncbi:MAG: histidinol-phosphate transaminase [Planctomycetota bacterium]|nr:histidinol-phosphate transaminase [Planctomycetota bacterium]